MMEAPLYFSAIMLISVAVYAVGQTTDCNKLLPSDELEALEEQEVLFPDKDQLDAICPGILNFADCYGDVLKEDPENLDEENQQVILNFKVGYLDLCVENSDIRPSYLEHVDCLKKTEGLWPSCKTSANEGYDLYKTFNDTKLPRELECFQEGHLAGCMSVHIMNTCSKSELSTYHHFMDKSRFLTSVCKGETAEALKTKYLDHLNLDVEVRKIYEETFDHIL